MTLKPRDPNHELNHHRKAGPHKDRRRELEEEAWRKEFGEALERMREKRKKETEDDGNS